MLSQSKRKERNIQRVNQLEAPRQIRTEMERLSKLKSIIKFRPWHSFVKNRGFKAELVSSWRQWDILEEPRELGWDWNTAAYCMASGKWLSFSDLKMLGRQTTPQMSTILPLMHNRYAIICNKYSLLLRISTLCSLGWVRRPRRLPTSNAPRTLR